MPTRKFFLTMLLGCFALQTHAAEWRECEAAKLRQLKMEHGAQAKGKKKASSGNRGPSKARQKADKLDEWLWKNCGNYANELRSLEQGRM